MTKVIRSFVAAAGVVMLASSASADIETFWKTNECSDFGGAKLPIARALGHMETVKYRDEFSGVMLDSVGGVYCNLDDLNDTRRPVTGLAKEKVNNSIVGPTIDVDPSTAWDCIVCQYENKIVVAGGAMPAISLGAFALLGGGGLFMMGVSRLRQSQK